MDSTLFISMMVDIIIKALVDITAKIHLQTMIHFRLISILKKCIL